MGRLPVSISGKLRECLGKRFLRQVLGAFLFESDAVPKEIVNLREVLLVQSAVLLGILPGAFNEHPIFCIKRVVEKRSVR